MAVDENAMATEKTAEAFANSPPMSWKLGKIVARQVVAVDVAVSRHQRAGCSMFNVVLIEPEIPPNTGNVGRLCLATQSTLHLVSHSGFPWTIDN